MVRAFLETFFLCGVTLLIFLEIYYLQNFGADGKILYAQKKKRSFLILLVTGIQVVPFLYIFSIDLGHTDYHLWKWLSVPVVVAYSFCVWVFVKSLTDLGRWWTPGQELKEDLELVKTGTYFYVRHPMYAALLGIAICQIFMIQNWIAGPVSLFLVTPFCIYQIRREESLLTKFFGDDYRDYIKTTGMLWPKEDKIPLLRKLLRKILQQILSGIVLMWHTALRLYRARKSKSVNRSL